MGYEQAHDRYVFEARAGPGDVFSPVYPRPLRYSGKNIQGQTAHPAGDLLQRRQPVRFGDALLLASDLGIRQYRSDRKAEDTERFELFLPAFNDRCACVFVSSPTDTSFDSALNKIQRSVLWESRIRTGSQIPYTG